MPDVLLIADDLTGAADSAATFAKLGAEVLVSWEAGPLLEADVVAFSTESRHVPASEAVARVKAVLAPLGDMLSSAQPPWIYKKIDSTLRGHPGLELATLMAGVGGTPCALVAPAYPAQGRVTREGIHYVHDLPLAETVFGREVATAQVRELFTNDLGSDRVYALPLSAVRGDDEVLAAHVRAMVGLGASAPCALVADAVTADDLARLAGAALLCGVRLLCGSAGLAEALAAQLAVMCGWSGPGGRSDHACRPGAYGEAGAAVLVVAASRHPRTARQLEVLGEAGIPVVIPKTLLYEVGEAAANGETTGDALRAGAVALTTVGLPDMPGLGATLASRLADRAAAWVRRSGAAGLVLTGGDAAVAVGRALGAHALRLRGEVAPGLPWGCLVGGMGDGLPVVTKAGGFGEEDALFGAVEFLRRSFV